MIERERYTPFGITMDNPASLKDQAGFTDHIKDSATGLNYMQARYYDPAMGRFLSIDPVTFVGSGGHPGYFNRYAYTLNDPVNLIDPFGECATDADGNKTGVCGTDQASQDLLDRTSEVSGETQDADYLAQQMDVKIDFTFDPNAEGGETTGVAGSPVSSVKVGGKGQATSMTDTRTGEEIPYSNSPEEITAHEVGGHVRDRLTGERSGMTGNRDAFTPNSEVNALGSENNYRISTGNPIRRYNYNKVAPMIITARKGGASSQLIYNANNLPN